MIEYAIRNEKGLFMTFDKNGNELWVKISTWDDPELVLEEDQRVVSITPEPKGSDE